MYKDMSEYIKAAVAEAESSYSRKMAIINIAVYLELYREQRDNGDIPSYLNINSFEDYCEYRIYEFREGFEKNKFPPTY